MKIKGWSTEILKQIFNPFTQLKIEPSKHKFLMFF